jgi:hypothetical protein
LGRPAVPAVRLKDNGWSKRRILQFGLTFSSFNGTCQSTQPISCPNPIDEPCMEGFCNPAANGTCSTRAKCRPFNECFSVSCQLGVCGPPQARVNASCTSGNTCYTQKECSAIGTCEQTERSTALPVGSRCESEVTKALGMCAEMRCAAAGPDLVTCSDLVFLVNCTQPSDPCMESTCNPLNGQCVTFPKCSPRSSCETASCSNGVCTYTPITGFPATTSAVTTSPANP